MTEDERWKQVDRIRAVHVVLILVTVLLSIAGIEASTRFAFARISRIESRIMTEHASVLRLPRTSSVRPILLVGDSLLLEDVDLKMLAHSLSNDLYLQRFSIEQTSYLDWLFGLRRM